VKDLSRVGRALDKTIIVDNLKENFQWQQSNGIEIPTWFSDKKDINLSKLKSFLVGLAESRVKDVREHVPQFKLI
jgi:TFIIF-interacting CTD phosphatase-like protein